MADLIGRTRALISDPAGAGQVFGDQEVQDALDGHRTVARYTMLSPDPTQSAGGVSYLEYHADVGDWEAGTQLVSASYSALAPSVSDYQGGRWTFAASTPPSVYILGQTYDINGAAADLLEQRAVRLAGEFDVTIEGEGTYRRSQPPEQLQALARSLRKRMRPLMGNMGRSDAH